MAKSLSSQLQKAKRNQLRQQATENTSVSRKVAGSDPEIVKEGTPLDHAEKRSPYQGAKFGMSKGITKNMGDYESLRVDVWLTDEVLPGETIKEAYERVESIIDEALEEAVYSTLGE